jgi:membrane-associated phospholipid phosphatase
MKIFLSSFSKNILKCFTGYNWLWHIAAAVLTYILVTAGLDWRYFVHTRFDGIMYRTLPAIIMGSLLPMLVPFCLVLGGQIKKAAKVETLGWALCQSALIGAVISCVYKVFTGRTHPYFFNVTYDTSRNFHFGFLNNGVFWGWPSSHTTIAFAMAFTLIKLFPASKLIKILSLLYALYIGLCVSVSINWFSEFAAGAIIGSLIGIVVGNSYKNEFAESISVVESGQKPA